MGAKELACTNPGLNKTAVWFLRACAFPQKSSTQTIYPSSIMSPLTKDRLNILLRGALPPEALTPTEFRIPEWKPSSGSLLNKKNMKAIPTPESRLLRQGKRASVNTGNRDGNESQHNLNIYLLIFYLKSFNILSFKIVQLFIILF